MIQIEEEKWEERMEKYLVELDGRLERAIEKERKIFQEDTERYIGGLTEDFQSKMDAVVEQYDSINDKLDAHTEKLDRHETKLNAHTEMIGALMEDVSELKSDMKEVKGELKQKADKSDFIALERRVSTLEVGVLA